MNIVLQERDFIILQQITKFRFLLSRQIKVLAGFSGQRACDRRVAKLISSGYIERRHLLYGVPSLYFATPLAKRIFNLDFLTTDIRIENIVHDIAVIDTAIYFVYKLEVSMENLTSERQLKNADGFGKVRHHPDFIYTNNNENYCVEIELNLKSNTKLEKNIGENYMQYDKQYWAIPSDKPKIVTAVKSFSKQYPNIEILSLEKVVEYAKSI